MCLGGALLIFTDGNNGPVVMNGAAWWEIRLNMRGGRENVVIPEDCRAIKLGGGNMFDLLGTIMEAVIKEKR